MRYFGRVAMGNFPQEFNWHAENEPIMANQVDHAPRWRCRLGYFSAGVTGQTERGQMRAKLLNAAAFWATLLGFNVAVLFHSGGPRTKREEKNGRGCRFGRVGSVLATPDSPPRGDRSNIGEENSERGRFGSVAVAFSAADSPAPAGEKRRSRAN